MIFSIFLNILTLPLLTAMAFMGTGRDMATAIILLYFMIALIWLLISKSLPIANQTIKGHVIATCEFVVRLCLVFVPGMLLSSWFFSLYAGQSDLALRVYGRVAFLYLGLTLAISPLVTLANSPKWTAWLVPLRKVFWIATFLFFAKHGLSYFSTEAAFVASHSPVVGFWTYVWHNLLVRPDALTGAVAGILMIVLAVTSNTASVRIFWGKRKTVQSLVYPLFLISAIHIAYSGSLDMFYGVLVLWLVALRTTAYFESRPERRSTPLSKRPTTRYICIPCGYIYDEAVGDIDGGIAPGTKFADIPDDWYCPVCGVSKREFEPYYEGDEGDEASDGPSATRPAKVADAVMLTHDVLELTIETDEFLLVEYGQYIALRIKDFDGEFMRSYSVVRQDGNKITFVIKLRDTGRAGRALKHIKKGDKIGIVAVLWKFILQDTTAPKIFIATGTGIGPLINMMHHVTHSPQMMLFRWFATGHDLFYKDDLSKIPNLTTEIYFSDDEVAGYHHGMIDLSPYTFSPDTEFYLCGNPLMVKSQVAYLENKWFTNIYREVF